MVSAFIEKTNRSAMPNNRFLEIIFEKIKLILIFKNNFKI